MAGVVRPLFIKYILCPVRSSSHSSVQFNELAPYLADRLGGAVETWLHPFFPFCLFDRVDPLLIRSAFVGAEHSFRADFRLSYIFRASLMLGSRSTSGCCSSYIVRWYDCSSLLLAGVAPLEACLTLRILSLFSRILISLLVSFFLALVCFIKMSLIAP